MCIRTHASWVHRYMLVLTCHPHHDKQHCKSKIAGQSARKKKWSRKLIQTCAHVFSSCHFREVGLCEIHLACVMLEKLGWELIGFPCSKTSQSFGTCKCSLSSSHIILYLIKSAFFFFLHERKQGQASFQEKSSGKILAHQPSPVQLFSYNLSSSPSIPLWNQRCAEL